MPKPTLTDLITIKTMKKYQRFPIPEALMGRQRWGNFRLKIDSLLAEAYREESMLEWANWRPDTNAPYNSMVSADEFHVIESEDSDEAELKLGEGKYAVDEEDDDRQFDLSILNPSPFRMESMKYYPYKSREGEVPLRLLKVPKLDWLLKTGQLIANEQKQEKKWSMKMIQIVFDYYCSLNKAASMPI